MSGRARLTAQAEGCQVVGRILRPAAQNCVLALPPLESTIPSAEKRYTRSKPQVRFGYILVGGGGFEPPKSETSDLQSDAFGHSAIRPYICLNYWCFGAGDWNRTRNLLITNQLLCQLSYTSKKTDNFFGALGWNRTADIWIFSPPLYRLSYQGIFILSAFLRRLKN